MPDLGQKMTMAVMGIVVAGLLLGYVFPVGLNAVNEDPTYSLTVDEGTEVEVQERLNATATTVDATNDEVTLQVKDTQTGTTESQTIQNGSTAQFSTLEGGFVNVTVTDTNTGTPNSTTLDFEVEQGFAWDDSSKSIFSVLGIFLVLVPLVVLGRMAMQA
jgi:hypothetical protein